MELTWIVQISIYPVPIYSDDISNVRYPLCPPLNLEGVYPGSNHLVYMFYHAKVFRGHHVSAPFILLHRKVLPRPCLFYQCVSVSAWMGAVSKVRAPPCHIAAYQRSEERRVGKECRSRWSP